MRIVFLGTPEFAVPSLNMLSEQGYEVCAVITQPDRPKGRGHKFVAPPVKLRAQELGIPVYQYEKISREGLDFLKELAPDLMITAAFGQILSNKVLAIPKYGCINVHASLLPEYRGAAPIERAIMDGKTRTGITTMYTVREVDAGDILEQDILPILPEDTGGSLREKLAQLGAVTLQRTLEKLQKGILERHPQQKEQVTYAAMFEKGFGKVDFTKPAQQIVNLIRGANPEPGAYTFLGDVKIKLMFAQVEEGKYAGEPGEILLANAKQGLIVAAGEGAVRILRLQYPGAKEMRAEDFLRGKGKTLQQGMRFC